MRKNQKLTSHTRKVCCILLTPCMLLSSCQKSADNSPQNLTQGFKNPTTTLQATQSPDPTLTTTPEPTPTITPIRATTPTLIPTPTLEPTPTPDFTFLPQPGEPDKTTLSDYMSQEEIDTAFSLSYTPDSAMQLYARYQGKFQSTLNNYCIDFIQVDNVLSDILINIKIYSGSVRYLKYGDSYILQNMYYYIDASPQLDVSQEVVQIMDLNHDGYDDFILDLGLVGNKNKLSIAFVYDVENDIYTLLGHFLTATYIPEGQTICEENYSPMGYPSEKYKYLVIGTETILTEYIRYLDDSYTYQKLIDGELVTVLEDVTYKELCEMIVNIETWRSTPASLE